MKCKYFYILKLSLFPIAFLCFFKTTKAQINHQHTKQIKIKKIDETIKIDGIEDAIWAKAAIANDFSNHRPSDIGLAQSKTEVRLLYNEQFIYILAKAYQENGSNIVQNLKRDNYFNNDGFGILLDPINKQTNGFFFGLSNYGAQSESLVTTSGGANWNWDAKWYSKVTRHANHYVVEIAIPFYTLRYDVNNLIWGINFVRNDLSNNTYSTWTTYPTNFSELDLGYTGVLEWQSAIPKVKKRLAIIPSMTLRGGKDFEAEEKTTDFDFTPSLDAKYALTSSLNLDLTINPDFSQIEVDRQMTNLSRFSLFFPERRTFFLENSDLFTSFGRFRTNPFFSRRIGLNAGENIPIRLGAKLTGNVNEKLRIGFLNVQTGKKESLDAQNYGVAAFQQRILKRSSISAMFVNRQNTSTQGDYNRVAATEFKYSSENGQFSGDLKYHKSFSDGFKKDNNFISSSFFVNARSFRLYLKTDHVEENFLTDVGFNPRLFNYDALRDTSIRMNYQEYQVFGAIDYRPKNGSIVFHGPRFRNIIYTNDGNQLNERSTYLGYEIDFANQSQFDAGVTNYRINLLFPTNFLNSETPLVAGIYNYTDFFLDWDSDPRKLLGYGTVFTAGSFFSGKRTGLRSYVQYRIQPWLRIRLDHNYNHVDLETFGKEDIHLLGFRTEISFSNTMFWTTFLQYNTQATNFNINSRFQWRFAPLSDLFVVYTNDYYSDSFLAKNRYLSVKINYWLNL